MTPVGQAWKESGPVFTTRLGTPIEPRNLNRHFARLLDRAGLRRIRTHDLRHSCATLLYEQDVPIEKIQDILGHSSPTITKLIYVEVTRQAQRSTTDKLGYLLGPLAGDRLYRLSPHGDPMQKLIGIRRRSQPSSRPTYGVSSGTRLTSPPL